MQSASLIQLCLTRLLLITIIFVLASFTSILASSFNSDATSEQQTTEQQSIHTEAQELKPGAPIERELAGGQSHSYRVQLNPQQYLKIVVGQKGIDVVVSLFAPDAQKLTEADNSGGSETVFIVAESSGDYRVEVRPADKEAKPGAYEIRVAELRGAMENDRLAVAAERLFEEGNQLRDKRTAESRRSAIKKYEEALVLWRKAGDANGEARTLGELGLVYSNLGDPKKAIESYQLALPLAHSSGDQISEATILTNTGTAYWRSGEPQKALESHNQALPLAKAAGDSQLEGAILGNTGAVYWSLGQPEDSLRYYNQALSIARARGDRRRQAITLNNIATAYQQLGELQKALEILTQVIELRKAMGDRQAAAGALHNLGFLHTQLGNLPEALEYYSQALAIRRESGDRQLEAITLQGISSVYLRTGKLAQAQEFADLALPLAKAASDPLVEAYVLDLLGKINEQSHEPAKALNQFEQALALRRRVADRFGEAYTLANIANSYFEAGVPAKALDYYQQSLTLSGNIGDRLGSAVALFGSARSHKQMGDKVSALKEIEDALAIIESTRIKVPSQEFRSSFLASYQDYFQLYIDLLVRMHEEQPSAGNDARAFVASERARARGLLELLTEAKVDVKQGISAGLKQRENDLQTRTSWLQSQLIQANTRAKPERNKIDLLEEQLAKIKSDRAELEIEIRQKHPRYADLQYPSPIALSGLQQALDEKTVLLEYSLGKEESFLFAISKNDFLVARLPAASVITMQVTALRDAVSVKPDRMALSNYLQKGRALYQDLMEPANRLLNGKQSLIIIPDGILHYLPFEVLLRSDSGRTSQTSLHQLPYLVRDFSISYAPSATVLVNLRRSDPATKSKRKAFIAYGDPIYSNAQSDQAGQLHSALRSAFGEAKPWELQPLPESRQEVEQIARLYPRAESRVFLGRQASEENVKAGEGPGDYRFVHFAVHGLLNEDKPQYSGLVLSLPGSGINSAAKNGQAVPLKASVNSNSAGLNNTSAEDGLLQVYEIFDLKMNADLVVLSACESGLGKETRGEGLVGLTQAFFYAGTPSLLVSLWKVQDKSTAALMVRFYQHLNNPELNKGQALRQAQLEMIRKGEFSHPYYWAPFVLTGQP